MPYAQAAVAWVAGVETGWRQGSHGTSTMKPRILEESYVLALMEGRASAMTLKYATFWVSCHHFSWMLTALKTLHLLGSRSGRKGLVMQ